MDETFTDKTFLDKIFLMRQINFSFFHSNTGLWNIYRNHLILQRAAQIKIEELKLEQIREQRKIDKEELELKIRLQELVNKELEMKLQVEQLVE